MSEMIDHHSTMNINHVTLTQLRALVSVIEAGSFTAASDRLHLSQSAISHALRNLERIVGCRLIQRSRQGVALTGAGGVALDEARKALDAIEALLRVGRSAPSGRVTVATVVSASVWLLPDILERVRRLYPSLELSVLVGTDREVSDWVAAGLADLGLTYDPGALDSTPLHEDEFVVIGRPDAWPGMGPVALSDLARVPFVMSGSGCEPMVQELFARADCEPNIVTTVSDTGALLALVRSGVGVSIVPGLTLRAHSAAGFQCSFLAPRVPRPLICVKAAEPSSAVAVTFVSDLLLEHAEKS